MSRFVLFSLALLVAACSEPPDKTQPDSCVPGEVQECPCVDAAGVQTCEDDGTFGECVCDGMVDSDAGTPDGNNDAGTPDENNDAGVPNAGTRTDAGEGPDMTGSPFDPAFLQVAEILTTNCALAACHGPSPNGVHHHPSGTNATPEEVQETLSVTTPAASGNFLISPGSPETSEIYIRISRPSGDPQLMGAATYGATGTPLQESQIETIRQWIADGAVFSR